ncbi:MAG: GAF domain-containing protein, partial [Deltaproteobacteria bacterium]
LSALAAADDDLDPQAARHRLATAWGLVEGAGWPAGGAGAVLAARRVLGRPGVRELAAVARDVATGDGAVLVAAELGDDGAVGRWLAGHDRPEEQRIWPVLLEILRERPVVAAGVVVSVAARLLAEDRAEEALRLLPAPGASGDADVLRVRALLRLGQIADAEARLADLAADGRVDGATLRALRIRTCVDRGDYAGALALGAGDLESPGPDVAEAAVWAAFAALCAGRGAEALAAMDALLARGEALAPGLRARAVQVRAGALLVLGRTIEARDAYLDAARLFEIAGEAAGRNAVEAAAAQLAVVVGADPSTLARTRRLLVRLLVQGAAMRAVDVGAALVRLLLRAGHLEEAEAVVATLGALDLAASPAADTRRGRARAEVALAAAMAKGRRTEVAAVGHELAEVAVAFDRVGSVREATEARLRAAVALARADDPGAAEGLLERAAADVGEDAADRAAVAIAGIEVAAARRDRRGLVPWIRELVASGGPGALAAQGRNDLVAELAEAAWFAAERLGAPSAVRAALRAAAARASAVTRGDDMHDTSAPSETSDPLAVLEGFLEGDTSTSDREPEASRLAARLERLERMVRIYRRLAHEEDVDRLLDQIVDAMLDVTGAERGAVVVRTEGGDEHVVHRGLGAAGAAALSRSVLARVFEEGEAVVSVDAMEDARFESARSVSHLNLRSVLAVPLRFRGRILGAAYVDHRLRRGHFGSEDLGDVEIFADLAATAVAHARTLADLRAKAAALAERERALGELLAAREAEVEGLRQRAATAVEGPFEGIVGTSPAMQKVFRRIRRIADADVPVVIRGESGTGKELVARAIHRLGPRASGPFVAENCGAIPKTLLESILFGHARGAFTGADRARAGLFEAAHGGTLFLDEVAELPLDVQAKLLRVLQEGEVRRLGETKSRRVDVRILAATHRDLESMVQEGTFREDLYYRLDVVRVEIPPLRERTEDLPALVEALLARHGAAGLRVAPEVFDVLARHRWPGNVRELENEVRRWAVLADGIVTLADLSPAIVQGHGVARHGEGGEAGGPDTDLKAAVADLERRMIRAALAAENGNISAAARRLGVSRYGLHKKIDRLGIEPPKS